MSIPQTLSDALGTGKVIPFVGAGVSMTVRNKDAEKVFPSWRELLERAADRMDKDNKTVEAQLIRLLLQVDPPDYLQAAKRIHTALGAILYDIIDDAINVSHAHIDPQSLSLAEAIWSLSSKLVVTTNYDKVLEWACPERHDVSPWNVTSPVEQAQLLREGVSKPTVWHLHGYITDKASLVLTPDGYERLYHPDVKDAESRYSAALETLSALLASRTFLFVGFSLDDEYFGTQLKGVAEIFKGALKPHYALIREADVERVRALRLPQIEIIPYLDHGEPLLEVLHQCANAVSSGKPTPLTTQHTTSTTQTIVASYDPSKPKFHVPYRSKGDQVIGRAKELQAVRDQLLQGRRTAIGQTASFHGLGGLGKTQLAVEYASEYRDSYPNGVYWLNADQDIDAQLTELAEKAEWVSPESEHKYKLDIAKRRFKTYSDCLLIFDNLEDVADIREYLPESEANPHILITSREDHPGFTPIPLEVLSPESSLQLLLQEAGREPETDEEREAAQNIANALDGLPLALELAGAFLKHRPVRWQQYYELLEHNLKEATKFPAASFTHHEPDLYSTLQISKDILQEEPLLSRVLDVLTWSGTAPMGISLLSALVGVANPLDLTGALSLGVNLRLLRQSVETESYVIHRLVSKVRREENTLEVRTDWVEETCQRIGDWFQNRRDDFRYLSECELAIDHLRVWQNYASSIRPPYSSRLLWLQAYPPYHRGRYLEARELVQEAIEFLADADEGNQELYAHLLNDAGSVYGDLGQYQKHLEYSERALALRLKVLGENHPDTARSLGNVGAAYGALGQHQKQLEYYEHALAILLEVLGENHPYTAGLLNNVGAAYGALGQHQKRLEYYERALAIWLKVLGENHPDTARSLNNVGAAYGALGQHQKELEYSERALAILLEVLGENHPDTARSLGNVGAAYGALGQHQKHLEYSERALAILLEVLGENHPDATSLLNNVGAAYGDLGQHPKQLECLEHALDIRLEVLGEKHPDTLRSVQNVAISYKEAGQPYKGFQLLDKFLCRLPKQHPKFKSVKELALHLLKRSARPGFRIPSAAQLEQKWGRARMDKDEK